MPLLDDMIAANKLLFIFTILNMHNFPVKFRRYLLVIISMDSWTLCLEIVLLDVQ